MDNVGCLSGMPDRAFKYILTSSITNETNYPYIGKENSGCLN